MSSSLSLHELVEIPSPYVEPRLAFPTHVSRKVDNLTLIDGKTFLATSVTGDIVPAGATDVGFFHDDTRFLSHLELLANGHPGIVLSSNTEKTFVSQIELTTPQMKVRDSFDIAENTIHIRRQQLLNAEALFDRFSIVNFHRDELELSIELLFDVDFVDVFQVRGTPRKEHGHYFQPILRHNSLWFVYRGLDDTWRQTRIDMHPAPTSLDGRRAQWTLKLPPLDHSEIEVGIRPVTGDPSAETVPCHFGACLRERRQRFAKWESSSTQFSSNNGILDAALRAAIGDFHALQISEHGQHVVSAGVPWFATLFGRDSIIAAYQTLPLNPQLAVDTLQVLARHQGKEVNDWRDEEPGKILHETAAG